MVGWHHQFDRHEFEQAPRVGDGQGSLLCCSPWGHKESDTTQQLNNNTQHVANLAYGKVLFWFFYFLAAPLGMQDLSSRTSDQTHASCMEGYCLDHWTPRPSKGLTNTCRGEFVLTVSYSQWQNFLILVIFFLKYFVIYCKSPNTLFLIIIYSILL